MGCERETRVHPSFTDLVWPPLQGNVSLVGVVTSVWLSFFIFSGRRRRSNISRKRKRNPRRKFAAAQNARLGHHAVPANLPAKANPPYNPVTVKNGWKVLEQLRTNWRKVDNREIILNKIIGIRVVEKVVFIQMLHTKRQTVGVAKGRSTHRKRTGKKRTIGAWNVA